MEIRRTETLNGTVIKEITSNWDEETSQLLSVTEVTTTAPNGTAQTTQYRYDGNGNLIEVTEPNIGTTTLTYDGVNRLSERTLPNGIRTIYTYKENTDFIESITHYAADGTTILSSVEYVRNPGGEPSRIIREDGSYVDLQYDDSLRLVGEIYYDSNGNLTDETTYTYDAAGNRQSASNGEAQGTYTYDNTHQLAGIDTNSGTETYTYDEGGRVEQVVRDGETLNLFYNSNDLIVKVTDANNNTVVEYGYDSNGRRVEMSDSNGEKNYLVAPNLGEGLDSPHLVSDAAGNPLASYVYAGSMPLMRLDANGNPTYYLEDGMGSVIGLADGTGSQVTGFEYDSFGNLRTPEGLPAELGGDFRFQGQWWSSNTDFYHIRARYYDPEVGRFISRDPVDLIEYEPESSNPYQFVYNNPGVYSDPTGMFTMAELNAGIKVQDILNKMQAHIVNETKQFLIDKTKGIAADLAQDVIENLLPSVLPWIEAPL